MKSIIACSIALLGVISIQLAIAAPADNIDCSKVEQTFDELGSIQGLTTLNDKYKLQTNEEEHVKRCTEMSDAIKSLRKYNKECYTSLTQQVISAMLRTRSQFNENRCNDPKSDAAKEGIEAAKCIADNSFGELQGAERRVIVGLQVLYDSNIPDDKLRTRRSCCAVLDSKKIFINAVKEKCSKYEKIYNEYVDSYTSEAMGLICPEADKLECDKLEAIKVDGVSAKTLSFLSPIVKLVKTLDH